MKTKTKRAPKLGKIAPKQDYTASIKVLGKVFNSTGSSIREAIANLKPLKGQGTAVLTVKHGDKAKDRILTAPQTFRLFSASPLTKEVALKHTTLLFDGSL